MSRKGTFQARTQFTIHNTLEQNVSLYNFGHLDIEMSVRVDGTPRNGTAGVTSLSDVTVWWHSPWQLTCYMILPPLHRDIKVMVSIFSRMGAFP